MKQRQYVECQTRHFWKWFIGEDRPLTEARAGELAIEFERVGRRTNEFVTSLLLSPEFRERDFRTPEGKRVDEVKAILSNCTSCHGVKRPDFTIWPIGGTSDSMKMWVGLISERLDLDNDGKNRDMPPPENGWQPNAEDLAKLKSWVRDGAPDENGDPQL